MTANIPTRLHSPWKRFEIVDENVGCVSENTSYASDMPGSL